SGVCIGSQLAPYLTDIYLAPFDENVISMMNSVRSIRLIVRYVDDILVLADKTLNSQTCISQVRSFVPELSLTYENIADDSSLRFLDLTLSVRNGKFCWVYGKK